MAIIQNEGVSIQSLSDSDKKKVKNAVQELNDSFTRVASERDLQKEIINDLNDAVGVDKKLIRKLAKTYFKANFNTEKEEYQTFEDYYSSIIQGN